MTDTPTLPGARPYADVVAKRRTFAIISHPDAGKTTLTEKFLLYGGAIEEAGSVRARKNSRRATSDWMEMEQQRGISITSAVLQFEAFGKHFNLLDTPGHQDFSEDTYRTLTAADCAVMVLDSARGIEAQTLKLFEVCRRQHIPIATFINKMDQPGQDPLELLDEIERVLGMKTVPMTWPIGDGPDFRGVYDLRAKAVLQFERTAGNRHKAPVTVSSLDDPALEATIGAAATAHLREQVELVQGITPAFDREAFLSGAQTPVYFGSALNNFGIESFLEALGEFAPAPIPRSTDKGELDPAGEQFAAFVFKIQANMDPQHRDAMAFARICSGRFEKDMNVWHVRLGRKIKLSRASRLFGRERETVEEGYAGDVVGLVNPGLLAIGDTLCTGDPLRFPPIPRFEPETFALLQNQDIGRAKQFQRGLEQLEQEGAVQVLWREHGSHSAPVLGAVGNLQFEVVAARMKGEYGVATQVEMLPHAAIMRIAEGEKPGETRWPRSSFIATDSQDVRYVVLNSRRDLDLIADWNPGLVLESLAEG